MAKVLISYKDIRVGDYFEDCAYHPCLCVKIDPESDEILGISLIDGSYPRACSINHCGPRLLSIQEVLEWKRFGPQDIDFKIAPEARWWKEEEGGDGNPPRVSNRSRRHK